MGTPALSAGPPCRTESWNSPLVPAPGEGAGWSQRGDTTGRFPSPSLSPSCTFWPRDAEAEAVFVPPDVAEARADVGGQQLGQVPAQGFGCFVGITVQHRQQHLVPAGLDPLHHLGAQIHPPALHPGEQGQLGTLCASLGVLGAYPLVVQVVHEAPVDLQEPVPILQPPALGQPPQLHLPHHMATAAQLLVEAEAEGLRAALAQEVEAGLPCGLSICEGAWAVSRGRRDALWDRDPLPVAVGVSVSLWHARPGVPPGALIPQESGVFTRVLSQRQGRVVDPIFGVKFKLSEMIKGRGKPH